MGFFKNAGFAALGGAAGYVTWKLLDQRSEVRHNAAVAIGKRIVILGAGFGGTGVAAELARLLPDPANGEITLVDEDNFLLFTPMLTEATGAEVDPRHVAVPVRKLSKRIHFVQGSVKSVDLAAKSVKLEVGSEGLDPGEIEIEADHLVIALGSVVNFHHVPGVAEHALGVKRLEDAAGICERVLGCLQRAALEEDATRRRALLTFVVAGGGYTGVETIAAINDLVRDEAAKSGTAKNEEIRTILINPGDRLLHETSPELAEYAARKLQEHRVEVRMHTTITGASADAVDIKPGERIPCYTLIWAAGVEPNPVASDLPCAKGKHGGIKVDGTCRVAEYPGVWALGDCAEIPNPEQGEHATYAPTAQNAMREGTLVARNIVRSLNGAPLHTFRYKPVGQLALVGKHSGVARLWGINLSGLPAWAMWRAVYLAKIPGAAQKVRVASDWMLDLLFGRDPIASSSQISEVKATARARAVQHDL